VNYLLRKCLPERCSNVVLTSLTSLAITALKIVKLN